VHVLPLERFECGAGVNTNPISYEVDGEQYIAVFAGGGWEPVGALTPYGDSLWAFRLGGTASPAATPTPPPNRNPITTPPVTGATANNTVTLGRIWNSGTGTPGTTENTVAQNAMSPQVLSVAVGATVTFVNPASNAYAHGAASFFEYEFDTEVLMPGQSSTHTFATAGQYYYNDPIFPQNTGLIIVK
jgi:plastocyanin